MWDVLVREAAASELLFDSHLLEKLTNLVIALNWCVWPCRASLVLAMHHREFIASGAQLAETVTAGGVTPAQLRPGCAAVTQADARLLRGP